MAVHSDELLTERFALSRNNGPNCPVKVGTAARHRHAEQHRKIKGVVLRVLHPDAAGGRAVLPVSLRVYATGTALLVRRTAKIAYAETVLVLGRKQIFDVLLAKHQEHIQSQNIFDTYRIHSLVEARFRRRRI